MEFTIISLVSFVVYAFAYLAVSGLAYYHANTLRTVSVFVILALGVIRLSLLKNEWSKWFDQSLLGLVTVVAIALIVHLVVWIKERKNERFVE